MIQKKVNLLFSSRILSLLLLLLISATVSAQYVPKDKRRKKPAKDSVKVKKDRIKVDNKRPKNTQDDKDLEIGRRWVFGGNFWLQFGNPTLVDISPTIGYKLTKNFIAGVGVGYLYARSQLNSRFGRSIDIQNQIYSGRTYLQYIINTEKIFGEGNRLFLYSEYEILRSDFYNRTTDQQETVWIQRPLIGGGLQQKLGVVYVNLMVLYNLNYLEDITPYPTPVTVRLGFNVGL